MSEQSVEASPAFLRGGGTSGEQIRNVDWAATSLGNPDQWPYSLRVSVSNLLRSGLPTWVVWDGQHCFYNDAVIPSLNPANQPTIGKAIRDLWPEHWHFVGPLLAEVRQTGEPATFQDVPVWCYRNGRTEQVYWTFSYSQLLNDDGQAGGVLITCLDTTKAVSDRQQLEASKHRFQGAIEAVRGVLWTNNAVGQMVGEQPGWASLTGQTYEEYQGFGWAKAVHPDDAQPTVDAWNAAVRARKPFVFEHRVRRNDDSWGTFAIRAIPLLTAANEVKEWVGVHTDLTEQRRAEEELRASEAKLRSVIDNAPVAFGLLVGPDLRLDSVNQAFVGLLGIRPEHLNKPVGNLLTASVLNPQPLLRLMQQVYDTGIAEHAAEMPVDMVWAGTVKRGYYNFSCIPLLNADKSVFAVACIGIDLTEQVLDRQKIEKAEASLRGAVDLAQLATWSMDIDTGEFHYSARFMEWLGLSDDKHSRQEAYALIHESYRQLVSEAIATVTQPGASGQYDQEHPIINRVTGQVRIIHAQAQVFYDTEGRPVSLSGTAQDVTIQRQLQQELEQQVQERTEQLAAVNEELASLNEELTASNESLLELNNNLIRSNDNLQQFAYVASHDLQEPLRKIQQFSDLLGRQYGDSLGDGTTYLQRMQSAASRMSALIRDLLSYSRISTQQEATVPIALNSVFDSVLSDLELVIQEKGAVVDLGELPTIPGDHTQLEQLFQNLLSNALKFNRPNTPPVIRISCRSVASADLPPSVQPTRSSRRYHCIDIADNGIGFDEKYLSRIFQVFQRLHTKSEFAGTGIGLAICEKVATNHGGAVTASSKPGEGATFSVYLPEAA